MKSERRATGRYCQLNKDNGELCSCVKCGFNSCGRKEIGIGATCNRCQGEDCRR